MNLEPPDILIVAAYFAGIVAFGVAMGRRQRSASDFVLAGRRMPWWLVLFSIVATETSTVTFLSIPGHAYAHDLRWLQLPMGFVIGRLAVAWLLLPRYFEGQLCTVYELLERRFGGATRRLSSALFVLTRTLADGLRLFLSAIVIEQAAGIPLGASILALGAATVVYTLAGGLRAVIWTDFIQFVVYVAGAIVAAAILAGGVDGGLEALIDRARAAGKLRVFDLGFDLAEPYQLWAGLVGGAVLSIASHGVDQMMVQRYFAARSLRAAAIAVTVSGGVVLLQFAFFLMIGVGLFVHEGPGAGEQDRVFAAFIVRELPVGLLGIVLGAVLAAAMSTLSSSLNSSATAFWNDLWTPRRRRIETEREKLRTLRILTLVFGAAQVGVALAGRGLATSVINHVLAIQAFTTGIILGVFVLGLGARRFDEKDALAGLATGLAVMTGVRFGTPLAWPWYSLVGVVAVGLAGLVSNTLRRPRGKAAGDTERAHG